MGPITKIRGFGPIILFTNRAGQIGNLSKTKEFLGLFGTGAFSDRLFGGSGWGACVPRAGFCLNPVRSCFFCTARPLSLPANAGRRAGRQRSGLRVGIESFITDPILASGREYLRLELGHELAGGLLNLLIRGQLDNEKSFADFCHRPTAGSWNCGIGDSACSSGPLVPLPCFQWYPTWRAPGAKVCSWPLACPASTGEPQSTGRQAGMDRFDPAHRRPEQVILLDKTR